MWSVTSVVVLLSSLVAAATDVWRFKIYNALTLPLLVSGILYHTLIGGPASFWSSLLGVAFGFFVLFIPFVMGGVSGGDVKLLAGLGAWLGFPVIVYAFIIAGLATALYAIGLLVFYRAARALPVGKNEQSAGDGDVSDIGQSRFAQFQSRRSKAIPFGLMVAVSVVTMLVIASASRGL